MARVLGPNGIPITSPTSGAPVRASPAAFGAPQAEAIGQVGRSLETLGAATKQLADRRKNAEDAAFLDRADLELDLAYSGISREEEGKARSGAEGMFDSVRSRYETETPTIIEKLRSESGHRPSEEALQKVQQLAIRRQHQHLTRTAAFEHNERIRFMGENLDNSLAIIANRGAVSGDIGDALERAEQSIKAYEGILPPAELAQMRERAAKHFYDQMAANVDPEAALEYAQRLTRGAADPRSFEQDNPETRGAGKPSKPKQPAVGVGDSTLTLLRREEGFTPVAKWDSKQWSIGYSTRASGPGQRMTREEAEKELRREADKVADYIGENVKIPLSQSQFDALVSFGFNLGTGNIKKLLPDINAGNFDRVSKRMLSFAGVDGEPGVLIDRRSRESQMMRDSNGAGLVSMGAQDENTIRGTLARTLTTKGPDLIAAAEKAREKRMLRERATQVIAGEVPVDPGSKADQETIDKVFAATDIAARLGEGDPQAAASVTSLVKNTGYVPDAAMSQLRAMSVNGDNTAKTFAFETAANLIRVKPGALDGSEKSRRLKDDAEMYSTLTVEMGLPGETAIQRIDELRSPEFEKRRTALKKEIDTFLKDVTVDEVASGYDGWFSSAPAVGGSPREQAVILDTYRDLVRDHYIRTGDPDVARSMAKKDLHRSYNVSEVTGKKRLMRHPPEMHYPAIEPRAGKDPDHSYFTDQLVADVKTQAGKDVPIEDIFIEAIPQTNMDVRSGKMPGYGVVWFEERDGVRVMQTAPGLVFRADVKGEMERQKKNREERARSLRQKEVERQEALENAPERRLTKQIIKGVSEDIDDPLAERTYTAPLAPGALGIN
jgi:GH24 family phage-related lysozyme (muramidase)